MKAMFLITEYRQMQVIQTLLEQENVPCRFLLHGHGSADSEMLDYLGLGDNKKVIAVTFIPDERVMEMYDKYNKKLSLGEAGKGIAFTVPMSGASRTAFALNETKPETEAVSEMADNKFEMIITVVNRGGFESVKEASRAAGARGGTLLHGLGLGGEEAARYLGITIQPEKDVVLIVVRKDDRERVMQNILDAAGIMTENRGICFSLPVDSAMGLAGGIDQINELVKK